MSIQKTTVARARKTDPQTSHDAAESVKNIPATQRAVWSLLESTPMCDSMLWDLYKKVWRREGFPRASESGVRTRRNELVKRGLVEAAEYKERMKTGGWGQVWRVTK